MRLALALSAILIAASAARADEREAGAAGGDESASAWPERLGPFEIATDDEAARLRVRLAVQLRLTMEDTELEGGRDTSVDLELARIRPGLRAAFLDDRLEAVLQLNVSPGSLELIDAFVDATPVPELRLRAGQFKIPFTLYREQSFVDLALVDWPLTTRWFGAERQLGLMAHDTRQDARGFSYALGVFGGQNRRGAQARELPRVYGERAPNPSDLTSPDIGELHPEIVGRAAHLAEGVHPETIFDVTGEPTVRHAVALSAAWDVDPVHRQDFLLRVAPELMLKWSGLSLIAIGYVGLTRTLEGAVILGAAGGFAELGWQPHRHVQLALRYSRVHVLGGLRADARAYAASIEPSDPALRDAWLEQYGSVGALRARHELGIGVTVPIVGRSLAWQTDAAWLRSELATGERDEVLVRTQLQLAF